MNEQDSQGKPLTTVCLAHRACPFIALGMSASVSNGSPSQGNTHSGGNVQPYEFLFPFLFFSLETDLRRFNYAEAEKSWVLRLRQQSTVVPLCHFSAVGNLTLAAMLLGYSIPISNLPSARTSWASQHQHHRSLYLYSTFLKRQCVVESGSRAMLATS